MVLEEKQSDSAEYLTPNTKIALDALRERADSLGLKRLAEDYAGRLGEGVHYVAQEEPKTTDEAAKQSGETMMLGGINTKLMTWASPDRPVGAYSEIFESGEGSESQNIDQLTGNVLAMFGVDTSHPIGKEEDRDFVTREGKTVKATVQVFQADLPSAGSDTFVRLTTEVDTGSMPVRRVDAYDDVIKASAA